jgi:hypothetical protein
VTNPGTPAWKRPIAALSRARHKRKMEKRPPAPFIVGVNRSGTTLLRLMLDAHPSLAIPPETHFLPEMIRLSRRETTRRRLVRTATTHPRWGDFGLDADEFRHRVKHLRPLTSTGAIRAFYDLYAEQQGKPLWGDKTPRYMRAMPRIERALPEARFIHLIRDGRDVALSQAERSLDEEAPSIAEVAERWQRRIRSAREQAVELNHYLEVRYEDLVADPETTLRRICEEIELPFDPAMLDYHRRAAGRLSEMDRDLGDGNSGPVRSGTERLAGHAMTTEPPTTDRSGRWQREMPAADVAEFERVAGDMLAELGYETGTGAGSGEQAPPAASASTRESS